MHRVEFVPVTRTTIEYRSGKKLLATIQRQPCGSHFCVIESTGKPVEDDGRINGKPGFHEPTLERAKEHVRDYLVVA